MAFNVRNDLVTTTEMKLREKYRMQHESLFV